MADGNGRNGYFIAPGAQCRSDRVIVREAIGDTDESAYLCEGFALERNRRTEAGLRKTESQANDNARQEMRVDAERGKSGP